MFVQNFESAFKHRGLGAGRPNAELRKFFCNDFCLFDESIEVRWENPRNVEINEKRVKIEVPFSNDSQHYTIQLDGGESSRSCCGDVVLQFDPDDEHLWVIMTSKSHRGPEGFLDFAATLEAAADWGKECADKDDCFNKAKTAKKNGVQWPNWDGDKLPTIQCPRLLQSDGMRKGIQVFVQGTS
ncbi:MAG: hypothetical protein ACC652_05520 [Acidimicrobiales bacterium]